MTLLEALWEIRRRYEEVWEQAGETEKKGTENETQERQEIRASS